MSLLMKALEKAAKDRVEARAEPEAGPAKAELALEPIVAPTPAAPRSEPAARPPARPAVEARPPVQPPRTAPVAAAPGARSPTLPPIRDREQEQAQAGTVLQAQAASRPAAGGVGAYIRARPVMVIGTVAGVFAAGFGAYVYLQIFNPGFFAGQPAVVAKGPPPVLKPPAPTAPAPGEPLATETVLKEAAAESAAAAQAAAGMKPPPAAPAPAPEETAARGNTIVVSPGSAEPVLNPLLGQAYAALQAGQSDTAQRLYGELLRSEPRNVDALLALAAIAGQRGNTEEAVRLYLQILELDPRHALAQSGLIALLGRADPLAAESKLKQLIAREPSAWLYFTLGNLYADQSLWAAAQQAYFQSHHLEPANPDYAYNLAVGLEHVSQPKLALGFYQRAVDLAAVKGRANFNVSLARERVGRLAQQVE